VVNEVKLIMISYNFNKQIHIETLANQIKTQIPSFSHITSLGQNVFVWFPSPLSEQNEILLQTIVDSHDHLANLDFVRAIVSGAMDFSRELMISFAAENVAMGITQAGKTKLIADACQQAFYYLSTGSLYEARTEMLNITIEENMAPFLTNARRNAFVNKIEAYLGIPLTT